MTRWRRLVRSPHRRLPGYDPRRHGRKPATTDYPPVSFQTDSERAVLDAVPQSRPGRRERSPSRRQPTIAREPAQSRPDIGLVIRERLRAQLQSRVMELLDEEADR